jgi:[acyl-carrier-protein] S-malonyltransferase
LVATGAFSFDEGVQLVSERAEAMHLAGQDQPGTMAAVLGLDDDEVEIACRRADSDVWVANFNAPGQVVIAGSPEGVASAAANAKELGAKKVLPLPVSGAFHTPFMAPARDRLRKAIANAKPRDTDVPVISNVDALAHDQGDDWASLLSAQLCSPVRWRQCLIALADAGVTTLVECGPGGVLTGMAKRTVPTLQALSVSTPDEVDNLLGSIAGTSTTPHLTGHEGEHLFATERLVVSPAAGVFTPDPSIAPGHMIQAGTVVGRVGDLEVRSPFGGSVMGLIAVDGERVAVSQPIAWLRTA